MTAFEAAFSCKKINHSQKSFCCCQTKTADDGDTKSEFLPYIQMMLKARTNGPVTSRAHCVSRGVNLIPICLFIPAIHSIPT